MMLGEGELFVAPVWVVPSIFGDLEGGGAAKFLAPIH